MNLWRRFWRWLDTPVVGGAPVFVVALCSLLACQALILTVKLVLMLMLIAFAPR